MSFSGLPQELKEAIWELALHAAVAEPEVCIVWPLHQTDFDQVPTPLVVDTTFPVLMHVCREWRDFVVSSSRRPSAPVRFRFSRQANAQVPYRHFRGDTDTLYVSSTNYEMVIWCLDAERDPGDTRHAFLPAVRHLAVEWAVWKRAELWLPELVFRACPDLQTVSAVFPSSRRAMWRFFQAPAKRCKLRRVEGADGLLAPKVDGEPGEVVSVQWQVDYGRDVAEDEAPFTWQNELDIHEMNMNEPGGEWFVGSAWDKEREKLCLEYEAAAFVQFKRSEDGGETWVEACENRLLMRGQDGEQRPPILNPEQLGRNPEEWRVNDEDDYQY
ncbi:hypothetical protein C8A05DRAFT_39754 [Staphylotrichum tortipilum]|uniref:2EXR domain-containing protein n=1 Tax=Staphylotrichum tortipilum TaxID=2831512 RepID=A0AAN6MAR1_9PEZI|nr:hypothetical protein C8A05DRAFT_39754 [Staphylotrichum longicolle]